MKNIKVIFKGNKSPSGMDTYKKYMIGDAKLKQLQNSKMFDIEILDKPKSKPAKKSSKKGAK